MARSTYIYIVENIEAGAVLAAFTVKHECVSWLRRQDKEYDLRRWIVMRVPDGQGFEHRDVPRWSAEGFLNMETT